MTIEKHHDSIHESLNFFRDNKTGADEHGVVASPWSEEALNRNKRQEKDKLTREIGSPDELCQIIMDTVAELNGLVLGENFQTDRKQQALLDRKIGQAKKLLEDTGAMVRNYVQSIESWQVAKNDKDKSKHHKEKYLQSFTDVELIRQNSHNALISQLTATIRFLNFNFSQDVSRQALENWENDQETKGQEILQVKRISFKQKNVILPDSIKLNDRKHITAWAEQISQSLTKIEKLLSVKPESSSNRQQPGSTNK